jgi:hypothetical protein
MEDLALIDYDVEPVLRRDPTDLALDVADEADGLIASVETGDEDIDLLAPASALDVPLANEEPLTASAPVIELDPNVSGPFARGLIDDDRLISVP